MNANKGIVLLKTKNINFIEGTIIQKYTFEVEV